MCLTLREIVQKHVSLKKLNVRRQGEDTLYYFPTPMNIICKYFSK